ncbi:organic cation transporter protein-like isoform X1 [Ostrea edulis]|uniref:organic cation transporter protein-like isoform X1 n=1 Tax=Ostrea edulis TaxID=37623 RepID=UPI0024AFBF1C|nr:organic cation transporter protein-like isoform X1 [Ostrea edulis]
MKFDDVLLQLGEFGPYQKRLYFLLCIPAISVGCYMLNLVIILETPHHRCKIPGYDNDTYEIQSSYHQSLINQTIPLDLKDKKQPYDKCHLYQHSNLTNTVERIKCNEWVYDRSIVLETFTTKANLVCEDAAWTSHIKLIFYIGVLVGDIGFGLVADLIGRRKTLMASVLLWNVSGFAVCWAPEYISFIILEFIVAAAQHGAFMVCNVMSLELVGPNKRVLCGTLIHGFFTLGLLYQSGAAYFIKHWKWIDLAIAVPLVFYIAYYWLVPESPRWLMSKGRYKEAEKIIQKAGKVNKVKLPEKMINPSAIEREETEMKLWHLFSTKEMFSRTTILLYNWIAVALMYFGVTMHAGNIGGNFYFNFFLNAIVEFPAVVFVILTMDRIGRKKLQCLCMVFGGVATICTIFTIIFGGDDFTWVTTTLSLFGKVGSTAAFCVIYVMTLELYPTVLRNAALGGGSCVGRVGSMLAPYVASSGVLIDGDFSTALPLVIFGVISTSAGILVLFVPESQHRKLPESVRDGIKFKEAEEIDSRQPSNDNEDKSLLVMSKFTDE